MQFFLRYLRPSALLGHTRGLRYAGRLYNGRKIYSDLPVTKKSPFVITFAGGATAAVGIGLSNDTGKGKLVAVRPGSRGKARYSNASYT